VLWDGEWWLGAVSLATGGFVGIRQWRCGLAVASVGIEGGSLDVWLTRSDEGQARCMASKFVFVFVIVEFVLVIVIVSLAA
jgi:hypothetical protein